MFGLIRRFLMEGAADGTGAGAGTGAGTGAPAGGTGAGAAAGAGTEGAPAAFDWTPHIADEGVRGWVAAKGYKDPAALAQSALNQEKLLGVPADKIIKLPTDDKPESWNPIYDRLGRPKEAKDYGLPVPEGDKGEFAGEASKWFHEAGLSSRQGRQLAEKWNAHVAAVQQAQKEATTAKHTEELGKLKAAWGPQFDANDKVAGAAAKAFGMNAEQLAALRDTLGLAGATKFLHAIGSKLGVEGDFVAGDGKPGAGGGFNTPESAKARIAALKGDKGWVKRWQAGDVDARAEMKRLHQAAYPEDTVLGA